MFRKKSDVDKLVKDLLRNVKSEHERNLRCYHIASMYYKAQDYESAKKYVSMYLTVRDDSSLAHKLLGQCYEGINLKNKALSAYQTSLELEANQAELILRICELLCDEDVEFEPTLARYWADRASSLFPHDPSVFELKKKLISTDGNIASYDLENLLHSELKARPTDISLRIKQLNLYIDSNRTELALNHAMEVESRQLLSTNLSWNKCISHICDVYHKESHGKCNWEFYIFWMSALDRVCSLSLSEILHESDFTECPQIIYDLDQTIFLANSNSANKPEIYKEFIKHIAAQLVFHITVLLLRRAKKGSGLWKETKRMIKPLLLMASYDSSDKLALRSGNMKEVYQKMLKRGIHHSRCRVVQSGQMLISLVKEVQSEKLFLEKVFHFTVNNWKQHIFQKIFSSIEGLHHSSSYFLTSNSIIPQKIPSHNSFKPSSFVPNFEKVYVGNLHHLVWLGIQSLQNSSSGFKSKIEPSFHTSCFKNLQFTVDRLNDVGVETLNQLDIDSFLYATVFCTGIILEDEKVNSYIPPERPFILPADISTPLCTAEQSKWWTGACSFTKSVRECLPQGKNSMSELRHLLQRGLEIVRGENIPLPLLINIARTFSLRAAESEKIDEAEGCDARALYLWQLAIPQLERLAGGHPLNKYHKSNMLFEFQVKDLEIYEVNGLLEEARYFIGCHLMKTEKYEEAIENFKNINTAHATFKLASIYQKLADRQVNGFRGEEVTSEMRCNQAIMASKARDSLLRTRDMIKDNPSHPFYHKIKDKLLEVDELLTRIEPENGTSNMFSLGLGDVDNCNTEGNLSCESGDSPALMNTTSRVNHSHRFHLSSTPNRHYESKHRSNSNEITEILIMQQNTSQLKIQQVLEHVKLALEKIEGVIFEQKSQRNLIEDLSGKFSNLEVETRNILSDIKKEVKRPDLYNMIEDEEYPDEMLQYQNYTPYYPPQRSVPPPGAGAVSYGGPTIPQYFSPRVDQMYQGNVSFYNQAALPFSDGQQLPDFLRTMQSKLPPSLSTPQGIASLQTSLGLSAAAASAAPSIGGFNATATRLGPSNFHGASSLSTETNRIPTNVVITTSDTLPKGVPPVQPTLSVTIPPQHRLGDTATSSTISSSAPHQFQIKLPPKHQPIIPIKQTQQSTTQQLQSSSSALESEDEVTTNELFSPEYDTIPDFRPVIPLSREVPIAIEEEREDLIFIGKAKLLRFADNNWIERGTGDLKILKDKINNKGRILMRTDLVHTICANHFIMPDMELEPMLAKKAWCWTAYNFSDKVILEKLCAKFRNLGDAQRFKDSFDRVKSATTVGKESNITNIPTNNPTPALTMSFTSESANITSNAPVFTTAQPVAATSQMSVWKGTSNTISSGSSNKINAGGFTFLSPPKFQIPEESSEVKPAETKKTDSPFANFTFSLNQNNVKAANAESGGSVEKEIQEDNVKSDTDKNSLSSTSLFSGSDKNSGDGSFSTFSQYQKSFFNPSNIKPFSNNQNFSFQNLSSSSQVFGGNNSALNQLSEESKQIPQSLPFQGPYSKVFKNDTQSSTLSESPDKVGKESNPPTTHDDFVPTAVFEPVIPLPELVNVVSGEEGETVLYEERGKLYRYCKENKQWKERGIGKMKILKNEESGVVRLVMRREQVLKVCCNHRITKDIVLSPSTTSDRSYSWAAKDFSEENNIDGVNEIFTLKLKTPEQAHAFMEAFEKAQAISADSFNTKSKENQNNEPLKTNYMEGTWECPGCYIVNNPQTVECLACGTNKPGLSPSATKNITTSSPFGFTFGYSPISVASPAANTIQDKPNLSSFITRPPGAWNCETCYVQNKAEDIICVACNEQKSDTKSTAPSVISYGTPKFDISGLFGNLFSNQNLISGEPKDSSSAQKAISSTAGGFMFGMPSNNKNSTLDDASKGPKSVFNFGISSSNVGQPAKSTFTFSLNKHSPLATTSPHKHESGSEHGDSDNEGNTTENDIYFQPVIPMPDKVTVITGEEEESMLYSQRAKLYRYDTNSKEWKERGIGDIKILKHTANGKVRLLLRREPVYKISLNHFLTPEIVFKRKDEKSWLWCAKDFASGEVVQEQFAIRFKSSDVAEEFKQAADDALTNQQKPDSTSTKAAEAKGSSSSSEDDLEVVYEQKVSDELRRKAESLMLPPNFYLYLQAKPCPGCRGCESDDEDDKVKVEDITGSNIANNEEKPNLETCSPANSTTNSFLKPSILNRIQTGTPTNSKSMFTQSVKNESSPSNTKPDSTLTPGKENTFVSGGFFTQSSFTSSPTPFNIFGGSALAESKPSQQTSIFGGKADTDPKKTPQISTSEDQSVAKSNQKVLFGDSPKLETKPATVHSIFGGTPQGGFLSNSTQKLFFGVLGSGDTAVSQSTVVSTEKENSQKTQVENEMPVFGSATKTSSIFETPKETEGLPFSTKDMISFSTLSAIQNKPLFFSSTGSTPVKWEGAGSTVFGNRTLSNSILANTPKTKNIHGESEEDNEETEHDPHFEPLIDLPELVDLKTGEEDEEVVFNQRAKLYRFDTKTDEWKERGVGNMKILKNREHNVYRLLMRREIVHKTVCNQRITPELDIKRLTKSEQALCWSGMNMAQEYEKPLMEQLSVKFKNKELANTFKQHVDDAINAMKS